MSACLRGRDISGASRLICIKINWRGIVATGPDPGCPGAKDVLQPFQTWSLTDLPSTSPAPDSPGSSPTSPRDSSSSVLAIEPPPLLLCRKAYPKARCSVPSSLSFSLPLGNTRVSGCTLTLTSKSMSSSVCRLKLSY